MTPEPGDGEALDSCLGGSAEGPADEVVDDGIAYVELLQTRLRDPAVLVVVKKKPALLVLVHVHLE